MQKNIVKRGALHAHFFDLDVSRARQIHQGRHSCGTVVRDDVNRAIAVSDVGNMRQGTKLRIPVARHVAEFGFHRVVAGHAVLQFHGRIERGEFAVVHDGDAVAELVSFVHVVRR
jgi:hypothetical protein